MTNSSTKTTSQHEAALLAQADWLTRPELHGSGQDVRMELDGGGVTVLDVATQEKLLSNLEDPAFAAAAAEVAELRVQAERATEVEAPLASPVLGAVRLNGQVVFWVPCPSSDDTGWHLAGGAASAVDAAAAGTILGPFTCDHVPPALTGKDPLPPCGQRFRVVSASGDGISDAIWLAANGTPEYDELRQWLGIADNELVAVCHAIPGEDKSFASDVVTAAKAGADALRYCLRGHNVWHSINPLRDRPARGRGYEVDVARLTALWFDVDYKADGLSDEGTGLAVVDDVSRLLGREPYVVASGNGDQPYWRVADDGSDLARSKKLLVWFKALVDREAAKRGGAVDSLFDLARIARTPGTENHKSDPPRPAFIRRRPSPGTDEPLALDDVEAVLRREVPEAEPTWDTSMSGQVLSAPEEWGGAEDDCSYATAMVAGILSDPVPAARHPWLYRQSVRLWSAYRAGCLTESSLEGAFTALESRFERALETGDRPRTMDSGDRAIREHTRLKVATKTDEQVWAELGGSVHGHALAPSPSAPADEHEDEVEARRAEVRMKFPRTDLAALLGAERPVREWLVYGFLASGTSSSLVAKGGMGKSLLALQLALCVARGEPFIGMQVRPAQVLYVDLEMNDVDLAERLEALGVTESDVAALGGFIHLCLPPLDGLDTQRGAQQIADIIDAYGLGESDLLILDSAQRMVEGDEDRADTWRALYRHTSTLLKRKRITVIRTDNTGKDEKKGGRGSSSKRDDVDAQWLYTRTPGGFLLHPDKGRMVGALRDIPGLFVRTETGHIRYESVGAGIAPDVAQAIAFLSERGVDLNGSERAAWEAVKDLPAHPTRRLVRDAIQAARGAPGVRRGPSGAECAESAPPLGAAPGFAELYRWSMGDSEVA